MFLYSLFIFVFSTNNLYYTCAHYLHSNEEVNKDITNKKHLIDIIRSLNRYNEHFKYEKENYRKNFRNDKSQEPSDLEKEKRLQKILSLIKKNYNAQEQYNLILNPAHSGARLYFIRNPDVVDEYKKYLKEKKNRTSRRRSVLNKLQEVGRKIKFRITEDSNDHSEINNYSGKLDAENTTYYEEDNLNKEEIEKKISDGSRIETYEEPAGKLPVDSLELHNEKMLEMHEMNKYNQVRHKMDFRSEKVERDIYNNRKEKARNRDSQHVDKYFDNDQNIPISASHKLKTNREKTKKTKRSYDSDKITKFTTKEYYKRKIDKPKYKPKYSNRKPKSDVKKRNDMSKFVRTSIPYVGKKGIFEDD